MNLGTDPIVDVSHNCSFYLDLISKNFQKDGCCLWDAFVVFWTECVLLSISIL